MQTLEDPGLSTDAPHLQVAAHFWPFKKLGPKKLKKISHRKNSKPILSKKPQKKAMVTESTRDFTKKIKENLTI